MAGRTRVVYLDVDDEITSAAARIRSADAPRVAIVVPPGSRVATSRINFRLLAREALQSGRQLAIVAPDAASRALAAAAGLDVFRTVGEYEAVGGTPAEAGRGAAAASGVAAGGVGGAEETRRPGARPADGSSERDDAGVGLGAGAAAAGPAATTDELRPRSSVAGVRPIERREEGPSRRGIALAVVGLLVLAAVLAAGVAGYLFLPQATIVVVPKVEPLGPVDAQIVADPAATTTDIAAGVVPAQRVAFQVQANGTFKATGQNVAETKATGTVTFTSQNTLFDVTVPAGTDVSTKSGVHFIVTQDVTVPKASFATGPTSVDTTVSALKPGPSGNVKANTIVSEPLTLSAALISVTNAQPTSGGSRTVTPKVAQADVDAAKTALAKQLQDGFAQQLQAGTGVPSGMTLFQQSGKLGATQLSADPATIVGQSVAQFTLGASATGSATAVDERPVTSVAEARLRSQVKPGYDLVAGTVQVTVGEPTVNGEQVMFPASATASEVRRLDAAALEAQIKGRSVDEARGILAPYGTVTITTWPDWVSSIPTYDFRVDLTIKPGAAVESPSPGPPGGSAAPGAASPSPS